MSGHMMHVWDGALKDDKSTMKTGNNKKDKKWLRNRNQRKNPKLFEAKFIQNQDGSFELIGGQTLVYMRKNQHSFTPVRVDTRDFACELRNGRILAK